MFNKKRQSIMTRIIGVNKEVKRAQSELKQSYIDLYLAMGFSPEQAHNMVK